VPLCLGVSYKWKTPAGRSQILPIESVVTTMPSSSEDGRDHIDVGETCRLGADLMFGELLPDKPGWLEQEKYEQRTSIGFQLERLAKTAAEMTSTQFARAARGAIGEL
jgi:hypothetical protein